MSEPLRTPAESLPAAGPQRDALIEKLLLAGLDHYFDGRYEQAVNVWTRVAFLERGHGRARAYIDRARTALAERHRQAEELLHRGIEAYDAGDLASARELLSRAATEGGANETALVFLQRLGRVETVAPAAAPESARRAATTVGDRTAVRVHGTATAAPARPRPSWFATAAVSVALASAILLAAQPIASWLGERPIAVPDVVARPAGPLPTVRASEIQLARARTLFDRGQPHDALAALDGIGLADPLRPESDRLKAEIQRALLAGVDAGTDGEARP